MKVLTQRLLTALLVGELALLLSHALCLLPCEAETERHSPDTKCQCPELRLPSLWNCEKINVLYKLSNCGVLLYSNRNRVGQKFLSEL